HYFYWLMMTMSPLLPLGWLFVAADRKVHWRIWAILITWFGAFLIFFFFFSHLNNWWFKRFFLPAYPTIILVALFTARDLIDWLKRVTGERHHVWVRRFAKALLLFVVLGFERHNDQELHVLKTGEFESMHLIACRMVEQMVPKQALIVSMEMSGTLK